MSANIIKLIAMYVSVTNVSILHSMEVVCPQLSWVSGRLTGRHQHYARRSCELSPNAMLRHGSEMI